MRLTVTTSGREQAVDVTAMINQALAGQGLENGLCNVFVPHTTAAITVNEGYDQSVMFDVISTLDKLVPWIGNYTHPEGNSAAHLKAIMVGASLVLPVRKGRLSLGRWQKVFFLEFDGPRKRSLQLSLCQALNAGHPNC